MDKGSDVACQFLKKSHVPIAFSPWHMSNLRKCIFACHFVFSPYYPCCHLNQCCISNLRKTHVVVSILEVYTDRHRS